VEAGHVNGRTLEVLLAQKETESFHVREHLQCLFFITTEKYMREGTYEEKFI
jgi:hypothetical protein